MKIKYLFYCLLGLSFIACSSSDNTKNSNIKLAGNDTSSINIDSISAGRQKRAAIRQRLMIEQRPLVAKFEPYDIHQLAQIVDGREARNLMDGQIAFSPAFKQEIVNEYAHDSLKLVRSIALIILKGYYASPFQTATEDLRPFLVGSPAFSPHKQYELDGINIDSASIYTYPLTYFFFRYNNASTYKISKAELLLYSWTSESIKKHPKLKNHPPIKKMLRKLAQKKWDDD